MPTFEVCWLIQVDADSAAEAAHVARTVQLDPTSLATEFEVVRQCGCGEFHEDEIATIDTAARGTRQ